MPAAIPDAFPLPLDDLDLASALTFLRASRAGASWQKALSKAAGHLPAARPRIDRADGALLLTSPDSGRTYRLYLLDEPVVISASDDHRRLCLAQHQQRACWHAAAGALISCIWRAHRPARRCRICRGPVVALAGEPFAECIVCRYAYSIACIEDLTAWPSPRRMQRRAA